MEKKWVFADGVEATLTQLEQRLVYAGLIEGYPCTRLNDHKIQWAREKSNLTLPPDITPLPGFEKDEPSSFFGKAEKLPDVQIQAYFTSGVTKQSGMCKSSMVITWWQNDYLLSLEDELKRILFIVDWWEFAEEWSMDDM